MRCDYAKKSPKENMLASTIASFINNGFSFDVVECRDLFEQQFHIIPEIQRIDFTARKLRQFQTFRKETEVFLFGTILMVFKFCINAIRFQNVQAATSVHGIETYQYIIAFHVK